MTVAATLYARPDIIRTDRPDGSLLLASATPLGPHPTSVVAMLRTWAAADPDRLLVAERGPDGAWSGRTYAETLSAVESIGQALLERGLSAERPLMILSGNSVRHLLMALGAMAAGVPVVPVSVAYSLLSRDHARLREIAALVRPGALYAEDARPFAAAVAAVGGEAPLVSASGGPGEHALDCLLGTAPGAALKAAGAAVDGGTVAKIMFTSGSTGTPKGVITTHGMLCANQQMLRQAWPFLTAERPVLLDWLPWSHTFGGSHNTNLVLANGGTLHIDDGRPTPDLLARTLANHRDVSPTLALNVPSGYAQLVPALERDRDLAGHFFARMRLIVNAAAALPSDLRRRLEALARDVSGRDIPVTGSWGATETAPAATTAHFAYTDARCIGVPLPGVTVKLVPADADTYEIRVRGASVTPGYHRRPDLADTSFDAEGFYRTGDTVSPADPTDPNAGLLFRGRLAENFKLATGTFVQVGAVRTALLSAAPLLSDAVIVGENRAAVGALAWLNPTEARRLPTGTGPNPGAEDRSDVIHSDELAAALGPVLAALNADSGSACHVERLLLMAEPPNLDAGEITDKGYINQRRTRTRRAVLEEFLYRDPPPREVILPTTSPLPPLTTAVTASSPRDSRPSSR